jgi:DNA-binding MarR family transcriptional regulator
MTEYERKLNALSNIIFAVFQFNGRLTEWGDRLCAPLGLSTTRWQILGAIGMAARPLTAPQIAYTMGLTRQGVQKQLKVLMVEGLVEQRPNPLHERSHLYAVTPLGKEKSIKARELYSGWLDQAAAGLTAEQLANGCTALELMTHNLEIIMKKSARSED